MSHITVRFGDADVNFGYDRVFGGYWGDIVPLNDTNPDRIPSHEFPKGYPFRVADSVHTVLNAIKSHGYPVPATAIIALRGAGHTAHDRMVFSPDGKRVR
jgi:hypothetical protein